MKRSVVNNVVVAPIIRPEIQKLFDSIILEWEDWKYIPRTSFDTAQWRNVKRNITFSVHYSRTDHYYYLREPKGNLAFTSDENQYLTCLINNLQQKARKDEEALTLKELERRLTCGPSDTSGQSE